MREFGPPGERVVLFVCALGPIHPDGDSSKATREEAGRDLAAIARILGRARDQPVHVVFVSTVLAITRPRPERVWYAGWKQKMEAELQQLTAACRNGQMSVVYPGRLVTRRNLRAPASLLATSYAGAARVIERIGTAPHGVRRILGIDARLLVGLRAVRTLIDMGSPSTL
jgi:hypothetical protein